VDARVHALERNQPAGLEQDGLARIREEGHEAKRLRLEERFAARQFDERAVEREDLPENLLQRSRGTFLFAAVRAAITIAQVLVRLGFTPRSDHAGQQRGACPLHGSTSGTARCFRVNTHAHTFPCFKCNRSGNALDLWAAANRLSIYDAAVDLCQRLHLPLPLRTPPPTGNREEAPVATGSGTCTIPGAFQGRSSFTR
jgi:hypothetical protein